MSLIEPRLILDLQDLRKKFWQSWQYNEANEVHVSFLNSFNSACIA